MGSIRTAIELQDNFSNVLLNVIHAVNLSVSVMERMQSVINEPMDTTSIQRIQEQLHHATFAVQELEAAMQNMEVPAFPNLENVGINVERQPQIKVPENITIPVETIITKPPEIQVPDGLTVPITPLVTEQPMLETPDPIFIPVNPIVEQQPQIEVPENIKVPVDISMDGISEREQRISEITKQLHDVAEMQTVIKNVGKSLYVLPKETIQDIAGVDRELVQMQQALEFLKVNPFQFDSSIAELQMQAMKDSLDEIIGKQQQMDHVLGNLPSQTVSLTINPIVPNPLIEKSDPVQVPIVWQSNPLEVFTSSGMDRFEMEVQSTNHMLDILSDTQAEIAARAVQTNIFPPNMIADMGGIQNRLQAIQNQIQAIEHNPMNLGMDTVSAELEQLRGQFSQAVQEQNELNEAIQNMDVSAANEAYLRLSQTISNTERYIRDNVDEQGRFNREIEQGTQEANGLMQMIGGIAAAYAAVQSMGSVIELSDTITQTTARLNLIVDDGGSVEELQNKIYASAQASRGSYLTTADAVSKLGTQASQAFRSNDELIAFTELLNKQFVIAGTSAQGIDSVMLQLTQSMAAGKLQGEELNAVMDNASIIVQDIQLYLQEVEGIDASNIKELASEGAITADIMKNAMFYAADEINAKFESMPMTFGQIWVSFQNTALMAFQPVLQRLNEIANSETFQEFVNHAIGALSMVAGITVEIFELLAGIASTVAENWSWLSPIIYGVAGALMVYYGAQLASNTAQVVSKGIHIAVAAAQMIHAAVTKSLTTATAAEIAAQNGLNTALSACPIVWIVVLIITLIALFYAAVAAVNRFAGTSASATGIIGGVFMVALAFIGNLFVAFFNLVTDVFVFIYNLVADVANFIGNVFTDPIGAICRLFFDLADTVFGILETLASAIDTIFGSNLAGTVDGWRNSLSGWVEDTFGEEKEIVKKLDATSLHSERFDYSEAWDAGYSFGEGIEEKIANFFDPSSLLDSIIPNPDDYTNFDDYDNYDAIDNISKDTGKIADSMDITEEELKYLRDLAEQETVNRFTTAEITIEQTNYNTVKNGMDLDGVIAGMTDAVNEAIEISTEGVHL